MATYLWIALGSALGGVARYWMTGAMVMLTGPEFPWGTIVINVLGSFVIGLVGALTAADGRWLAPADARMFLMVGVCGGFTTFSSFSLQTLVLMQTGELRAAAANIVLSVALCVGATALGAGLAQWLNRLT